MKDSKFIDNKNLILCTEKSYDSPEAALIAAEHDIYRYEEYAHKMHIKFYEDAVMDIEEFKKHASFEEADKFEHKDAYQTLYREGPDCPVHVYKSYYKEKLK